MTKVSGIPVGIFRQYDVRGIVDRDLTPHVATALGRAYANFLDKRKKNGAVAVGRDNRPSGPAPPAKVGPARNRLTTPAQTAARVPARRGACSNAAPTFRQAPGKCVRTISIGSRKRKEWTLVGGPGPGPGPHAGPADHGPFPLETPRFLPHATIIG